MDFVSLPGAEDKGQIHFIYSSIIEEISIASEEANFQHEWIYKDFSKY